MPDELVDDRTFAGVFHRHSAVLIFNLQIPRTYRGKYGLRPAILHEQLHLKQILCAKMKKVLDSRTHAV
jgi:hypothetical protein